MKSLIYFVLAASALMFFPMSFIEDCETPKAWMVTGFGCFALFWVRWRALFSSTVGRGLLAFLASAAISTGVSIDRHRSFFGDPHIPNGLFLLASYVIFYAVVSQNIVSARDKNKIAQCLVTVAAIVSVHALLEVAGIDFLTWTGFPIDGTYFRPPSTLGHPNYMAAYVSMVFPFTLWFSDMPRYRGICIKVLLRVVQAAMIGAIFASQSRGAWVATLVSTAVYFRHAGQFWKKFVVSALAMGAVFSIIFCASPSFRENAAKRAKTVLSPGAVRMFYSTAAISIWKKHPWLGCGTDAYSTAFAQERTEWYWGQQPNGAPTRAHDEALNILATQGLLGVAALLALTISILTARVETMSWASAPATASIASFYVFNLSGFPVVATSITFMVCLALLSRDRRCSE